MKEFNPPNSYLYEEVDYHGKRCIHIQHKKHKELSFVYNSDMNLEDIQASIQLMEENFKRH